jgi:hypothetical protein
MKERTVLPTRDVEPQVAERIRRRALLVLERERARTERGWVGDAARLWDRALEPSLAAGVVAIYLAWAVEMLGRLLG